MKKNSFKIGVILAYVLIIVNLVYGFIVTPFLVKQLNPTNYGAYKTISSLTGMIAVLDFGISSAVVRFVSKYYSEKDKENESKYLGACFYQCIFIIIFLLIAGLILYTQLTNIYGDAELGTEVDPGLVVSKKIFILLILNCAISIPGEIFNAVIVGHKKYAFANLTKTLKMVVQLILILVVVPMKVWDGSAVSICFVLLLTTVLFVVVDFLYVCLKLKLKITFRIKKENKWIFKESFVFMLLTFIQSVLIQFEGNLDVVLIAKYINSDSVTLYSIALLFYSTFNHLSTAISNLILPKVSQIIADGGSNKDLEDLTIRIGRIQFMMLGAALLGFISLGQLFIRVWQGDGFDIVWPLATILLTATFIPLFQNGCLAILRAKNKIMFRTIAIAVGTIFNFVFTLLSVSIFPCSNEMKLIFACLGTAISLIGANIIAMNIYYKKVLELDVLRIFKGIFSKTWLCLIPPFIITFMYGRVVSFTWLNFFIGVFIFVIIYGLLLFVYGFNNHERKMFFAKLLFSNSKERIYQNDNHKLVLYPIVDRENIESIYLNLEKKYNLNNKPNVNPVNGVFNETTILIDETVDNAYSHNPDKQFNGKSIRDYKNIIIICHSELKNKYKKAYGFGVSMDEKIFSKRITIHPIDINSFNKNTFKSKYFFKGLALGMLTFFSCFGVISVSSNHLPEVVSIAQSKKISINERYVCKIKPSTYPIYPQFSKDFIQDRSKAPSLNYFYSSNYGYGSYYAYVHNESFKPLHYMDGSNEIPFNMFASNSLYLNKVDSFANHGLDLICFSEQYEEKDINTVVVTDDFANHRYGSPDNALGKTIDVKLYYTDPNKRTQRNFKIVGVYKKSSALNFCVDCSAVDSFFTNISTIEMGWAGLEYMINMPSSEEKSKDTYLTINQLLDNYSYTPAFYVWNKESRTLEIDSSSAFYKYRNYYMSPTHITLIVVFSLLLILSFVFTARSLKLKMSNISLFRKHKAGFSLSFILSIMIAMILSLFMCAFWSHKLYTFSLIILPIIFSSIYIIVIPRLIVWIGDSLRNEAS